MRRLRRTVLAAALALAACGESSEVTPGTPDAGTPANGIQLVDWVTSMTDRTTDEAEPDTVDDKPAIVIDTDDPGAFDGFVMEPQ